VTSRTMVASGSPELVHQGAIPRPHPSFQSAAEAFFILGNKPGSRSPWAAYAMVAPGGVPG
jgi:hypothetical protein